MSRMKGLAAIFGAAVLMAVVAACSQPQSATPTPTVAPVDTLTAVDGGKLLESCVVTESGPRENPVLVARGLDPIPSGFDAGNHASCTFARPISAVKLELLRDGKTVVRQVIPMDAPTTDVRFPLSETPAQPIGADLDTGGYDHRITAATEDGEEAEVLFNADAIWVLDPDSSPKDLARRAMIAAREAYAEAQGVPYFGPALVAFEPVEWGDASLACPKPDVMYAQVITSGFRLVFEHEGRRQEYHTNRDGSTVVGCGEATTPESGSTAEPTRTPGETAPDEEPSTFDDSANLVADPNVATVIIGQVAEKSGERTLPLAGNSDSVRFGYWSVRVERYLVTALPYTEITVRLEQMFVRPDGSLVPPASLSL